MDKSWIFNTLVIGVCAAVLVGVFGNASAEETADAGAACSALARLDFSKIKDAPTQIMDAKVVQADGEIPAHCHAEGYIWPQVGFEIQLPLSNWNGKFLEMGTGGYAGTTKWPLITEHCDDAVRRGYACIHSDHGHASAKTVSAAARGAGDGIWAYNNLQAEIDYGFRGLHVVALAGKALVKEYYGVAPQRSYFYGCSGGGRQAMVAAQRFPWQFDGIIAMDPAMNLTGLVTTFMWDIVALTDKEGRPIFTREDLELLHHGALGKCDLNDGVEDGVIAEPLACDFDPGELQCKGVKDKTCLSERQVVAARKVYAGPTNSAGEKLYPGGTMPGAELGHIGFGNVQEPLKEAWTNFFRYMAFIPDAGPDWRPQDMDFDADYKRLGMMEAIYDATDPDLRNFKQRGGKLIIAQGWDDGGSPMPLGTIDYYETMRRTMGGREATEDFARLFMMPGRAHCAAGDGANAFDFLGYLEAWVEQGKAPDVIIGAHIQSNNLSDYSKGPEDLGDKVAFTRPVYPYPIQAKYTGEGEPNDYRNFRPFDPTQE